MYETALYERFSLDRFNVQLYMISIHFHITIKRERVLRLHHKGAPPQSGVGKKTPERPKKETSIKTALHYYTL